MTQAAAESAHAGVSISLFFPCHNEAANVDAVVRGAVTHLTSMAADFEIIVVDDGSTDGTAERAEAIAKTDSRVRVVSHAGNRGYGHALRTGFASASKDLVCYTDGDGQFTLEDLPAVLAALGDHGFVLGYRLRRADPLYRRINARLWETFVRLALNLRVRDLDCGFKLFRRSAVSAAALEAGRGAAISAELIARAVRAGHTFSQVGVRHFARRAGKQSGNSPAVVAHSFVDIARLWIALR